MNKITIPLGDGFSIVAEKNCDPDFKEIFVYLYNDNEELVHQDLAIIGEDYTFEDEVTPIHGQYTVKVYGDDSQDDWTDSFLIDRWEEGES